MKPINVHVKTADGSETMVEALDGWQLMEVLRDYGFKIKAECGGACCCATCHVYIDKDWLDRIPPMSDEEEIMLDSALEVHDNSRLSCQIVMNEALDGLGVTIAPNPD